MRRLWGLVVLVVFGTCVSLAQNSQQYRACVEKAGTQTRMHACANEEAMRVDAELKRVHEELVSKAKADSVALAKIEVADRSWIAYRDAYIDARYPADDKQGEYGSMYPMEVDLLRARLTRQQIAALRELMQQFETK